MNAFMGQRRSRPGSLGRWWRGSPMGLEARMSTDEAPVPTPNPHDGMTAEQVAGLLAGDPDLAEKARLAGCPVHLGADFGNNPYPDYADFRKTQPIQPVTMRDGTEAVLLTRMVDVRAAFSDLRLSNNLTPAPKPKPVGGAAAAP